VNRPTFRIKTAGPIDRPIRTEKEYTASVREIEALLDLDVKKGTPEYNRLELLSILVEAYENEHDEPIVAASPQQVVDSWQNKGECRGQSSPN
jgi:antitoxin component HigA of HigAB toxin-antitoxin module